jgi:hypothetical protein
MGGYRANNVGFEVASEAITKSVKKLIINSKISLCETGLWT